jgi:CHASE1-domain containing sensor protein
LLSLVLAWMLQRTVQTMAHERAVHRIDTLVQGLEHSVNSYGEIVKGLQARFSVKPYLSRQEFDATMVEMDVPRRYPGLRALTFTRILAPTELAHFEASLRADGQVARQDLRIRFAADRSEYAVVDYVWPLRGNAALAGLDVSAARKPLEPAAVACHGQGVHDSAVHAAAGRQGSHRGADPCTGVCHACRARASRCSRGCQHQPADARAAAACAGRGAARWRGRNGGGPGACRSAAWRGNLRRTIYRTPNWEVSNATLAPVLRDIAVHDRIWRVQLLPRSALLSQVESAHPWLMGAGGLAASALLALLVALLARQRQQARQEVEHTQSALQESMDRFHDLFHHCGMGVSKVCSETGRLLQVNQRYCEILGFSEKELLRTNVLELSAPEDVDDTRRLLSELRQGLISTICSPSACAAAMDS